MRCIGGTTADCAGQSRAERDITRRRTRRAVWSGGGDGISASVAVVVAAAEEKS